MEMDYINPCNKYHYLYQLVEEVRACVWTLFSNWVWITVLIYLANMFTLLHLFHYKMRIWCQRCVLYIGKVLCEFGNEVPLPILDVFWGGWLSYDRDSLIRLFDKMDALKDEIGWGSKNKLDKALKEWRREDRLLYSLLREAMTSLDNIEKYWKCFA